VPPGGTSPRRRRGRGPARRARPGRAGRPRGPARRRWRPARCQRTSRAGRGGRGGRRSRSRAGRSAADVGRRRDRRERRGGMSTPSARSAQKCSAPRNSRSSMIACAARAGGSSGRVTRRHPAGVACFCQCRLEDQLGADNARISLAETKPGRVRRLDLLTTNIGRLYDATGFSAPTGWAALTGYSVLDAPDLAAAAAPATGCPLLGDGGTVDVYQALPMWPVRRAAVRTAANLPWSRLPGAPPLLVHARRASGVSWQSFVIFNAGRDADHRVRVRDDRCDADSSAVAPVAIP
jgi:hypothetical protein